MLCLLIQESVYGALDLNLVSEVIVFGQGFGNMIMNQIRMLQCPSRVKKNYDTILMISDYDDGEGI